MKRFAFFSITIVFAIGTSFAADPTPAPLEIKNKSSFKMQGSRNPFWPIGWKPSNVSTTSDSEHSASDIPESAFLLTSVTIEKGARFAIINGKIIQEGQQFGLQMGTNTYQLTLKTIEDGRVILSRRDQEIIVPLRRK